MTRKSKPERVARGRNAERLLSDETLREAFSVLISLHSDVIFSTNTSDDDALEARRMVLALNKLDSQLQSFIADGKLANL